MDKMKNRFLRIIILVTIILIDVCVYLFLGLLLMNYEDSYDSSKGEYWSLSSMNTSEKIIYICYIAWIIINLIVIALLARRLFIKIKYGKT